MKIFVATKEKQGERKSDFCWADEGELVTFGGVCGSGECDVDAGCGCQRSMIGIESRKGTTTVKVVALKDLTLRKLQKALVKTFSEAYGRKQSDEEAVEYAKTQADELIRLANSFKVGDVVEIRGDHIQTRQK